MLVLAVITMASLVASTPDDSDHDSTTVEAATSTTVATPGPTLAPFTEAPTLSCDPGSSEETSFPSSALSGPTGAEQADTPEAAALRAAIADPSIGPNIRESRSSWRLLTQNGSRPVFAAGDGSTRYEVTVEHRDGGWKFFNSGGCTPVVVEPGLDTAHLPAGTGFPSTHRGPTRRTSGRIPARQGDHHLRSRTRPGPATRGSDDLPRHPPRHLLWSNCPNRLETAPSTTEASSPPSASSEADTAPSYNAGTVTQPSTS